MSISDTTGNSTSITRLPHELLSVRAIRLETLTPFHTSNNSPSEGRTVCGHSRHELSDLELIIFAIISLRIHWYSSIRGRILSWKVTWSTASIYIRYSRAPCL